MTESEYKYYGELPLFLNAKMVGEVLGVSPSSAYELLHQDGFPTLKIGNRLIVPKEKFIAWVEQNTAEGDREGKGLIKTEKTSVFRKDGSKWNGNLKFTICPIQSALDFYNEQQLLGAERPL